MRPSSPRSCAERYNITLVATVNCPALPPYLAHQLVVHRLPAHNKVDEVVLVDGAQLDDVVITVKAPAVTR